MSLECRSHRQFWAALLNFWKPNPPRSFPDEGNSSAHGCLMVLFFIHFTWETTWYLIVTALKSSLIVWFYLQCLFSFLIKHSKSSSSQPASCSPHTDFYLNIPVTALGDWGLSFPSAYGGQPVLVVREHGHLIELLLHWSFGVMLSLSCLLNPNSFNQVGKRLEARSCSRGLFLTPQECTEDVGINQQGAQVNLGLLRQGRDISVDAQCAHVLWLLPWGKEKKGPDFTGET